MPIRFPSKINGEYRTAAPVSKRPGAKQRAVKHAWHNYLLSIVPTTNENVSSAACSTCVGASQENRRHRGAMRDAAALACARRIAGVRACAHRVAARVRVRVGCTCLAPRTSAGRASCKSGCVRSSASVRILRFHRARADAAGFVSHRRCAVEARGIRCRRVHRPASSRAHSRRAAARPAPCLTRVRLVSLVASREMKRHQHFRHRKLRPKRAPLRACQDAS